MTRRMYCPCVHACMYGCELVASRGTSQVELQRTTWHMHGDIKVSVSNMERGKSYSFNPWKKSGGLVDNSGIMVYFFCYADLISAMCFLAVKIR